MQCHYRTTRHNLLQANVNLNRNWSRRLMDAGKSPFPRQKFTKAVQRTLCGQNMDHVGKYILGIFYSVLQHVLP